MAKRTAGRDCGDPYHESGRKDREEGQVEPSDKLDDQSYPGRRCDHLERLVVGAAPSARLWAIDGRRPDHAAGIDAAFAQPFSQVD